jgi:hypothetical protein
VLGSVAEKVLRRAGCPVLTVPRTRTTSVLPFKRVLCAVDFSDASLTALQFGLGYPLRRRRQARDRHEQRAVDVKP